MAEAASRDQGEFQIRLDGISSKTHSPLAFAISRSDTSWGFTVSVGTNHRDLEIHLHPEQVIRGQLIDLEGKPAAQIELTPSAVTRVGDDHQFSDGVGYRGERALPRAWLESVVSDNDGRFAVQGMPAGVGVVVMASGSELFAQQEIAVNTGMPKLRGDKDATCRRLVEECSASECVLMRANQMLCYGH